MREYDRTGKRVHVLQTVTQRRRQYETFESSRTDASDASAQGALGMFKDKTNSYLRTVPLKFRADVAHQGGGSCKYGAPMSVRRSILSRAMESPHLLRKALATGRAGTFQVSVVTLVDGPSAWRLTSELGGETIVCRPVPNDGVLELNIVSRSEMYTVPFGSVYAVAMDLAANARPSDADGVVTISFAIVHEGRLQILSVALSKKDVNTCRMLVNIVGLQKAIFESALVEGAIPSERANLLRAIERDGAVDGAESRLTLAAPWKEIELRGAVVLDARPRQARICRS
jgi:hypothetical protein